ncbi:MAG: acylneuraminate cytidylyltransferase family protein [Bacteroidales bacterium]|nr:acylneuraminate cytidylyltransferase family protein [Bacteroidales bacterium]
MRPLIIIPARGGSKGVPGKNIKLLSGKPLIYYTIEAARNVFTDDQICVSTDDFKIKEIVELTGLKVPFLRPESLAQDTVGTYEVLLHALEFYSNKEIFFDTVVLLQPTSPFRNANHIIEALKLYSEDIDMIVSVCETKSNPYFNLMEEDENGFLKKSKEGKFHRRQDCPKVWEFNGAIYIINVNSLKKMPLHEFKKTRKYIMDEISSHDIDTLFDWQHAEIISSNLLPK